MMHCWMIKKLLNVLLLILFVGNQNVESIYVGELSVEFVSYTHQTDQKNDGSRCDKKSLCDPRFIFCLSTFRNLNACSFKKLVSHKYSNIAEIKWRIGSDLGSEFTNPVIQKFDRMPEIIAMEIKIEDVDENILRVKYTPISTFTELLKMSDLKSGIASIIKMIDEFHNLTLTLRVTKTCSNNQYGITCEKQCFAPSNGHCNSSGDIVCYEGWILHNSACVPDLCKTKPCQNHGSCHQTINNTIKCVCSNDYQGDYCQTAKNLTIESSSLVQSIWKDFKIHLIVGICAGVLLIILIATLICKFTRRRRCRQSDQSFLYLHDKEFKLYKAPTQNENASTLQSQTNRVYLKSDPLPDIIMQQISSSEGEYEEISAFAIENQSEQYQSLTTAIDQPMQGGRKFIRQH